MRHEMAADKLEMMHDQLDGVRASVQLALERMDALMNPPRRGPMGVAIPFSRRSRVRDLATALHDLQSGVGAVGLPNVSTAGLPTIGTPKLPSIRPQRRPHDWSGGFAAAALLLAALGMALLWFGDPKQALKMVANRVRHGSTDDVPAPTEQPIPAI